MFSFHRKKDSKTYQATTWQIKFELKNIEKNHTYTLRVAIASATFSELQVREHVSIIYPFQLCTLNHQERQSNVIEMNIN